MCEKCDRAHDSLQELDQRLGILEYHVWSEPYNPLYRQARNELKRQTKRAEEDYVRLQQSLHGESRLRSPGPSVETDKRQLAFDL